jgi:hypothetical protein
MIFLNYVRTKLNCKFIHKWYTVFKNFSATLADEKGIISPAAG